MFKKLIAFLVAASVMTSTIMFASPSLAHAENSPHNVEDDSSPDCDVSFSMTRELVELLGLSGTVLLPTSLTMIPDTNADALVGQAPVIAKGLVASDRYVGVCVPTDVVMRDNSLGLEYSVQVSVGGKSGVYWSPTQMYEENLDDATHVSHAKMLKVVLPAEDIVYKGNFTGIIPIKLGVVTGNDFTTPAAMQSIAKVGLASAFYEIGQEVFDDYIILDINNASDVPASGTKGVNYEDVVTIMSKEANKSGWVGSGNMTAYAISPLSSFRDVVPEILQSYVGRVKADYYCNNNIHYANPAYAFILNDTYILGEGNDCPSTWHQYAYFKNGGTIDTFGGEMIRVRPEPGYSGYDYGIKIITNGVISHASLQVNYPARLCYCIY